MGLGYAVRFNLVLENGELVVTGLWRTQRVPVQKVVHGQATKSGISFAIDDGRRILARAVETANSSIWTQQSTRAYDVIEEVMAAARVARESHPATVPDAALIRRNVTRRRNISFAYMAFFVLVVAAGLYVEFHS